MINFDINEVLIKFNDEKYKYQVDVADKKIYIKRILNNSKIVEYMKVYDHNFEIFKYDFNLKENNLYMSDIEKYKSSIEIIDSLYKNNLCRDVIDLKKLKELIVNKYINILIANETIGLSSKKSCKYLDIILLETYEIIGYISIDYDVKIKVDSFYYEQVVSLLKNYVDLYKNNNKSLKYLKD